MILGLLLVNLHKWNSEPATARVLCSSLIAGEGWLEINTVTGKSWVLQDANSNGVRYRGGRKHWDRKLKAIDV